MEKKLLPCLLFLLLFSNVNGQTFSEIKVRFTGFDPSVHKGFVDFYIPDAIAPFRQQVVINQNGEFYGSLNIKETREVIIQYDDHNLSIILSPGDQIALTLSLPDYLSKGEFSNFNITGYYAVSNKLIIYNEKRVTDWILSSTTAFRAPKTMDVLVYKAKRINEMNDQLQLLDNLMKDNKIEDTVFLAWARSDIRYATAIDLSLFPFMARFNPGMSDQNAYFDYTLIISPNEKQPIGFKSYFSYIETLCTTLQIIANTSDYYAVRRNKLNNKPVQYFPIQYSVFSGLPDGRGKEWLLARLFQTQRESIPAPYWDSLSTQIDPHLVQIIKEKKNTRSIPISELIASYPITDKDKQALFEIYSDAKGKVIYHDFVCEGCPACLAELPAYNELIERAGKEVQFVFLGVNMTPAKLSKMLDKYQLPCKQYVLSKNQFAFYEKYFNIRSFPHHHLVDKGGMIIGEKTFGLSQYSIEDILKKLEKIK